MCPVSEATLYASSAVRISLSAARSSTSFSRLATSCASGMAAVAMRATIASVMTSSMSVKPRLCTDLTPGLSLRCGLDRDLERWRGAAADCGPGPAQHVQHRHDVGCGTCRHGLELEHHEAAAALHGLIRRRRDVELGAAAARLDLGRSGGGRHQVAGARAHELQGARVEAQLRAQVRDRLVRGEAHGHLELLPYLHLARSVH